MQPTTSPKEGALPSAVTPTRTRTRNASGENRSVLGVSDISKGESSSSGRVFGAPLAKVTKDDPSEGDSNVPAILDVLVREICARGLKEEGILRVPGSHEEIEAIRLKFEQKSHARDVNLKQYDVLSVGGVMKAWLREIPHSFLTCSSVEQQQIIDWTQAHPTLDENLAKEYREMLEKAMPPIHLSVLRVLCQLVLDITAHEELNKMTTDNVLTCLLPSMKVPTVIFIRLLQNLRAVFPQNS